MKKIIKGLLTIIFGLLISIANPNYLKAASASISVTSSSSKVVVGKSFTVYIKVSSSTALGAWNFTPSYDKSKLKLVSGSSPVVAYGDGKIKSKTYTYTFKAISSGTSTISVKTYEVLDYKDTKRLSTSVSSKTIKVITQSELEASYSKNNDLKSLSVDGLKLSPKFDDKTLKYTAQAGANTTTINIKASPEDTKSKVSGTGKKKVSEGENKFKIVVTAQNGSTKTYTLIVNVTDPSPIEVVINDQKYTIVKRESNLEKVEDFTNKTIKINNQNIPSLFNEENNITLVGLKDSEGDVKYFIYNEEDNSYKEYIDITLSKLRILPLSMDKKIGDYKNETITIDEVSVDSLNVNDHIYIIKAKNFDTTEENYYFYDKDNNSIIKYYESEEKKPIIVNTDVSNYKKIIAVLGIETVVIIFILICILIKKVRKNKRKREYLQKKIEEEKQRQEEVERLKSEVEEIEKKSSKSKSRKKEVSKNEKKKNK